MKRTSIQILWVCGVLAGLGLWIALSDGSSPNAGADQAGGTARSGTRSPGVSAISPDGAATRGGARRGSRDHPGISTERARLLDLIAEGRVTPENSEHATELAAILVQATQWNRKELRSVIGDLMNEPLTEPACARPFMKLLGLYSLKDPAGALDLYDQARQAAELNTDTMLDVHQLVLNLADIDPGRAEQWVANNRDILSPSMIETIEEKIRRIGERSGR